MSIIQITLVEEFPLNVPVLCCFFFLTVVSPVFLLQARMALDKGAQAVIFDVSDDANAAAEVRVPHSLKEYIRKLQVAKTKMQQKEKKTSHSFFVFCAPLSHSCGKPTPFPVQWCW